MSLKRLRRADKQVMVITHNGKKRRMTVVVSSRKHYLIKRIPGMKR